MNNFQSGGPHLLGYPRLLIQCIPSCPPNLKAFFSICNLRARHAVVTKKKKKRTEILLEASRDVGLEINIEKTQYTIMSRHPKSGRNQNVMTANESFKNVAKFKYLGTTLTNQNDIHDEIKSRTNLGNACYHSVQNILSSRLI
jgi:hypothetical protein